jgi:TolB-like protein/Tfp pilus assembly protein PilF
MTYRFGGFSFDPDRCELRSDDVDVPLEPQVLALLALLIENRHRLVGKDEIVARVWNGRIITDAAIASRIKTLRQALGDDGADQRVVRTVRKLGFRFVAEVEAPPPASPMDERAPEPEEPATARPSIAVLPFTAVGGDPQASRIAEAVSHDLIVELSRLRWLLVIARGSSFQFRAEDRDLGRVRSALRVRYVLTGGVEFDALRMAVTVELSDTDDGAVVWAERFHGAWDAVHELRERIVQAITGALELQIPLHEARRARLHSTENLDAWSAYHLGLRQMYLFSRDGNAAAAPLFERAIALDPSFARAHAGLSFTYFEDVFLRFAGDFARAEALAQRHAEAALEQDPLDPFCNLVMGRLFWLRGQLDASLPWLDRAIELNPNYAQAKYSRGWSATLLGAGADGGADADAALRLSPLDPLAYGMLGVKALANIGLDRPADAAAWAERAVRAPGAHALIEMIAAVSHTLNGDAARASYWAASARRRTPNLDAEIFLKTFPFRDTATQARIRTAFRAL